MAIATPADAAAAWQAIGRQEAVLEAFIDLEREISVVAARGVGGEIASFGAIDNMHRNHILDISVAPAPVSLFSASVVTAPPVAGAAPEFDRYNPRS